MTVEELSESLLLVSALLAGEFDAGRALCGRDAIWCAAFSANSLNAGIALLHDDGLARHGFADQALGLLAHRLLRHSLAPVMRTSCVIAPMLPLATGFLSKNAFSRTASLVRATIRIRSLSEHSFFCYEIPGQVTSATEGLLDRRRADNLISEFEFKRTTRSLNLN